MDTSTEGRLDEERTRRRHGRRKGLGGSERRARRLRSAHVTLSIALLHLDSLPSSIGSHTPTLVSPADSCPLHTRLLLAASPARHEHAADLSLCCVDVTSLVCPFSLPCSTADARLSRAMFGVAKFFAGRKFNSVTQSVTNAASGAEDQQPDGLDERGGVKWSVTHRLLHCLDEQSAVIT